MLIIPFFLAVSIALLKSFNSFASLLPTALELSPFLIPIPTPLPKAPPEKVGPTKTTGFLDLAA